LEKLRAKLDSKNDIRALWKVAPGWVDKTHQVYFQVDDTVEVDARTNMMTVRRRMVRV